MNDMKQHQMPSILYNAPPTTKVEVNSISSDRNQVSGGVVIQSLRTIKIKLGLCLLTMAYFMKNRSR